MSDGSWKKYMGLAVCAIAILSCTDNGNETLVLPNLEPQANISQSAIPDSIQQKLEAVMPIYEGTSPPIVNGCYIISPTVLEYATDSLSARVGGTYSDITFCFKNQNSNTNSLSYSEKEESDRRASSSVSLIGNGSNFTAYFVATGYSDSIYVKTATVISGSTSSSGIRNLYYSVVMLDKGYDPSNQLMEEGEFREFTDDDGLASATSWNALSKVLKTTNGLASMEAVR